MYGLCCVAGDTSRPTSTDMSRASGQQNLLEWKRAQLSNKRKLKSIMDARLEGQYSSEGAHFAALLTLRCLESQPKNSCPSMRGCGSPEQIRAIKEKPRQSQRGSPHSSSNRDGRSVSSHHQPSHYKFCRAQSNATSAFLTLLVLVEKAVKIFGEMEKNGVKPDLVTFNTVLVGLYSSKRFLEGEKMWRRMIETGLKPDIRSWNARIIGYVNEKRFDEAVKALSELDRTGLKLDAFSYRALIKGYCDEENLKEAKKWYAEFVRCEHPDKVTLETVISLAMKKGDLSWAVELCKVIFDRKCLVNAQILQEVVDTLVKDSRFQDAKRIVEMGNTNSYRCYKLNLPSEQ
ncbi:hypothetical protein Leryth_015007 [Lithospermum erythrorhizon]|nr:hypothetical protein Leryth_015007 [Lithospermum erythrorhizon]